MPINQNQQLAIIGELENTRIKGNRLLIRLLFAGKKAEADEVGKKVETLGAIIDGLLAESMNKWSGNGKAIIEEMKKTNRLLQRDISYIKKKKEFANKVVKALGRLDEVILTAKDLF